MGISDRQQQIFDAINKRLGFDAEETSEFPADQGSIVLSKDPKRSSVPPKMLTLANIDELKALLDLPAINSDEDINYPSALDVNDPNELTSKQKHQLKNMMNCCLIGDAAKIPDREKALIQSIAFPMTLAAFSVESYTVKNGEVLTLDDGTTSNFGTLTVEQGGQIECIGTANLNCQNLIQNGAQSGNLYTINLSLPEISPPQATAGDPGKTPTTPGAKGNPGANCASHCKKAPTNGGRGHNGGPGGNGENGSHGANGPILHCQVTTATGTIRIYAGAQEGQIGGVGGVGGTGGPGGPPGTPASNCSKASTGPQGNGGKGGDGGVGGNGGDGAQVYFYYTGSASVDPVFGESNGAKGGAPGKPGGGPSNDGPGDHGDPGDPGAAPVIRAISS